MTIHTIWFGIILLVLLAIGSLLLYRAFQYRKDTYITRKTHKTPYVNTFDKDIKLLKRNLILHEKTKLCDLGCGDGKTLRQLSKHFHITTADGYDTNESAIKWGKLLNTRKKNNTVKLYKQNFFEVDITQYNTIYTYLFPHLMDKTYNFIKKKASDKTLVIANTFPFPKKRKPIQIIKDSKGKEKIFIYET